MSSSMQIAAGLLIPFAGTTAGSACVFFMKERLGRSAERVLTGFAAGVMVAASVWSLLIPALEQSEEKLGRMKFIPAVTGFLAGIFFLLLLDWLIPHLHLDSDSPEGIKTRRLPKNAMMLLAVTLHNIPEGMAVGVVYAGFIYESGGLTSAGALALAVGIAIQNFPEGAIISMPLRAEGIHLRHPFGSRGARRYSADHTCGGIRGAADALPPQLRGGCYALCGGGGAYPRNVLGRAFKPRDRGLRLRLRGDDDPGLHFRMKERSMKNGKNSS